jgi:hypothetical protein
VQTSASLKRRLLIRTIATATERAPDGGGARRALGRERDRRFAAGERALQRRSGRSAEGIGADRTIAFPELERATPIAGGLLLLVRAAVALSWMRVPDRRPSSHQLATSASSDCRSRAAVVRTRICRASCPLIRETGIERAGSRRSLVRPDHGVGRVRCEAVAVVAGHGLA